MERSADDAAEHAGARRERECTAEGADAGRVSLVESHHIDGTVGGRAVAGVRILAE